MVVSARLLFIERCIKEGKTVSISLLPGADKMKIKFRIGSAASEVSAGTSQLLLDTLRCVSEIAEGLHGVDRGHKHSSGHSDVALWLSPRQSTRRSSPPTSSTSPISTPRSSPAIHVPPAHSQSDYVPSNSVFASIAVQRLSAIEEEESSSDVDLDGSLCRS